MDSASGFGYADRLKPKRKLGGQLGAEEYQESVESIAGKADDLAKLIQGSQEVFIFTGAGISTSMGIPDFRGPNGIWTARKKKRPVSVLQTPFEYYRPSFTHMAIAALVAAGKVKCVCSQNVDCLHLRSGIPRSLLAELHGNCFAERCEACKREYTRDFQVETVDFQPTGRLCVAPACGSRDAKAGCRPPALLDNVLDWDSALPDDELDAAIDAAKRSDLTLVLGSSLQISPANEIPTLTPQTKRGKGKEKGKMVIVNLQKTPKDRSAHALVRARVDPVFARIMLQLGLPVPPYIRLDGLVISHVLQHLPTVAAAASSPSASNTWGFKLALHSVHGQACVMPMVRSAKLELLQDDGHSDSPAESLHGAHVQLLCSAWPSRQQQMPASNPQTRVGTAGNAGAGGSAAMNPQASITTAGNTDAGGSAATDPQANSATAGNTGADLVAPGAESAGCAARGHGSGHNGALADGVDTLKPTVQMVHSVANGAHAHNTHTGSGHNGAHADGVDTLKPIQMGHSVANADAGASYLGQQAPSHAPSAQAACWCEAAAPCSSAASAPNGGPFIFSVSDIPLPLDKVRCRISLRLMPWADTDKQSLLLPDYVVQHEPAQPPQQHAHKSACLLPTAQENGQGGDQGPHKAPTGCKVQQGPLQLLHQDAGLAACSVPTAQQNGQGGDQGSHRAPTDSTDGTAVRGLLAGLPSDFDVALVMDAAGLGSLPCHANCAPPRANCAPPHASCAPPCTWQSSKQEPQSQTGAGGMPAGVGVKTEQGASLALQGQGTSGVPASGAGPGEVHAASGGVRPGQSHAAGEGKQIKVTGQPPAALVGVGESNSSDRSGGAGPCPTVAAAGPCFNVITYVSQEQHYDAAQVWDDFQANPPPVKLAKVRGAASEDQADDAKRARRGASDEAGAEALAAGLRRSGRQRKPVQRQQQDTDTEDGDEQPLAGELAIGDWEPVPLCGDDEAGSE